MPATENVWRNLRTMHVVFAVSSIALFASTLWMMKADYADEWRAIRKVAMRLEDRQLYSEYESLDNDAFAAKQKELKDNVD